MNSPTDVDTSFYEMVDLGSFTITPNLRSTEEIPVQTLTFYSTDGGKGLSIDVYTYENGTQLGYDADRNGEIDFYAQLNGVEFTEFTYLDATKAPLRRFTVSLENEYQVKLNPTDDIYPESELRGIFGGEEKFTDCFKRRMKTTHGIIMLAASSLIPGGAGPLAVCAGGALSCVLWTPN